MTPMPTPTARGKVRDIYDLGDRLFLVASDRISAYDCILGEDIPKKGEVLAKLSAFWFERTADIVGNHFLSACPPDFPPEFREEAAYFADRSMIVKKAEVIPIECVVRGYLAGSGWAEYQEHGTLAGAKLPAGLKESSKLPEPVFTPSTKAEAGHDENITREEAAELVGADAAGELERLSKAVYSFAADYAAGCGIIIADTKFEFGLYEGRIILIDEVLTPDSSRFWPADSYAAGGAQPSFDKQFVRDYLDSTGWDREPPPPPLTDDVVKSTSEKYLEAYERLTGLKL